MLDDVFLTYVIQTFGFWISKTELLNDTGSLVF